MKKSILFIALAALLLSFVSYGDGEIGIKGKLTLDTAMVFGYPDSTVRAVLNAVKEKYDTVPYFTKFSDGKYLFYVVKGKWKGHNEDTFYQGGFKMGIIDEQLTEILPVEYDKIYNPGATITNFIEVEKNGRKGLFNFKSFLLIKPQYDVIYRSKTSEYLALGKKVNAYYQILLDGSENISSINAIPTFAESKVEIFNKDDYRIVPMYRTDYEYGEDFGNYGEFYGSGTIFTPSYVLELGVMPEVIADLTWDKDIYGTDSAKAEILPYSSSWANFKLLFGKFYLEGVSGRDYQLERTTLVTVDKNSQVIASAKIDDFWTPFEGPCRDRSIKFLNDSIVEVLTTEYADNETNKYVKTDYSEMTFFNYFYIDFKGNIVRLESNRFFDFTKFIEISDYHLKGCYWTDTVYSSLQYEDLDVMRNEIFAEYGYIFKSKNWHDYFSQYNWYKPQYNDVERFLTPLDKRNIDFILKAQKSMKR